MTDNPSLIRHIRESASVYLDCAPRDERVLQAMLGVDRADFVPPEYRDSAYWDDPVPIGFHQTCSQPSMVAFMLDKLEIGKGDRILEIGAGCGYAAAIASILCGASGRVYACEIVPELAGRMRENLKKYSGNIDILARDGSAGFPEFAPFDRIFLSAGVTGSGFCETLLLDQLKEDGILLYPEAYGNLYRIRKKKGGIQTDTFFGVSFVPLIGRNA